MYCWSLKKVVLLESQVGCIIGVLDELRWVVLLES